MNPCHNFHFEDVQIHSPVWDILQKGFITENIFGESIRVYPDPKFKGSSNDFDGVTNFTDVFEGNVVMEYLMKLIFEK